MPQAEFGMVNDRLVLPAMNGAPKGPVGLRVSATRQGATGTYRKPAGADTVMFPLVPLMEVVEQEIFAQSGSMTVSVCVPSVTSEAENVPTPLTRLISAGRV